jgi:hypothetical protein
MTIPTKVEINCATGVISEVPLNDDELAQLEIDRANAEAARVEREAAEAAATALKESAKAKLVAGEALTEEEAATLVI